MICLGKKISVVAEQERELVSVTHWNAALLLNLLYGYTLSIAESEKVGIKEHERMETKKPVCVYHKES